MKKYLILLSSIFIFFIGANKVNAVVGGTTLVSGTDYTVEQVSIDELDGTWQTVGTTLCYNCSYYPSYNFLINRNDYSKIAIGLSSNAPYVNVITFNNFTINNFALFSNSSMSQPKLILSEGNLPSFGGSCNTGSFCYNFINSGYQGNGYSATVHSNTIYIDSFGISPNGSLNMGYPYFKLFQCSNNANCYVGTGSPSSQWGFSNQTVLNSVYFTTQTLTNGTYQPINQFLIEREPPFALDPDYTLDIEEGSERGKSLVFRFSNFNEDSEIHVNNLTTGDTYSEFDLSTNHTFIIDNISFDSVFYYEIYNNDELVFSNTIDIYSNYLADDVPLTVIEQNPELKQTELRYVNLKSNYKVYYAINNDNFINIDDNPENLQTYHTDDDAGIIFTNTGVRENNNYVIIARITDDNDIVLYEKSYNIVYFKNKPYFTFKSSYNSNIGGNDITITYHNFQNNDVVYYSFDNSNWTQFTNINVNKLEVFSNVNIYTKAVRGNDTYYGFYQVNLYEYDNNINDINNNPNGYDDTNLLTSFKNVFSGVDLSFLNNVSIFWNQLKSSMIFKYILLMCIGSMILFILRLIRR